MIQCAVRELQEELRLSIEPANIRLLGSVYADSGGTTSKHLAIVYEWKAETDDIAIVLSTAEFLERQGTSLSGSFISVEDLHRHVAEHEIAEEWSAEIVRELLSSQDT